MRFILFRDVIYNTARIITVMRDEVDKSTVDAKYRHFNFEISIVYDDSDGHDEVTEFFETEAEMESAFTLLWNCLSMREEK